MFWNQQQRRGKQVCKFKHASICSEHKSTGNFFAISVFNLKVKLCLVYIESYNVGFSCGTLDSKIRDLKNQSIISLFGECICGTSIVSMIDR